MNMRNLGSLLIIVGLLLVFIMFMFSSWNSTYSFMDNLRYSALFVTCTGIEVWRKCEDFPVSLGQGLILPLVIIAVGVMINKGIISEAVVKRILPFMDNNN